MSDYEPEIGQLIAGGHAEFALPDFVQAGLETLTYLIGVYHGRPFDQLPGGNVGADNNFEGDAFSMRGYCWCDGTLPGHEDECPPNFEYGDLQIRWYKYLGRGMSANQDISEDQWRVVMMRCIASLQTPRDLHV